MLGGCVQKSSKKTIFLKLHTEGNPKIQTVGVRGSDKPLSWDYDFEMKPVTKDSIYETTYSFVTGYAFTELKFTINGQFELNNHGNRRIVFGKNDTIIYEARFNEPK
jgi:putative oxidoreductase